MMTSESLTNMVKSSKTTHRNKTLEKKMEIPTDEVIEEPKQEDIVSDDIIITNLTSWFENNFKAFENINQVKVAIRGIDPRQTLIVAVKDVNGGTDNDGNEKRQLRIFENANTTPVLNLHAVSMEVYNNGFSIINQYSDEVFIKAYGVRTGLICVFCNNIDGRLIPYKTKKVNKKESQIEMIVNDVSAFKNKLSQKPDLEALQLLYKQSIKVIDDLKTNEDVVNWMLERQVQITDINHHLQIDAVLIDMLR